MSKWKKAMAVLFVTVGMVLPVLVQGCSVLSEDQKVKLAEFQAKATELETQAIKLVQERDFLTAEVQRIQKLIKDGKATAEDTAALLAALPRLIDVGKQVAVTYTEIKDTAASANKVVEEGAPWWTVALSVASVLAGIAGVYFPAVRPLQAGLSAANANLVKKNEMAAALSRSLDAVSTDPETKEATMLRELSAAEEFTKADMDALRKLAAKVAA